MFVVVCMTQIPEVQKLHWQYIILRQKHFLTSLEGTPEKKQFFAAKKMNKRRIGRYSGGHKVDAAFSLVGGK